MRIEFDIENIQSKTECVRLVRLALLNDLHNDFSLLRDMVELIASAMETKIGNINIMLLDDVTQKAEVIAKELSKTIKPYTNENNATTDLALIYATLALLDVILSNVSNRLKGYVANELQKLGGVIK